MVSLSQHQMDNLFPDFISFSIEQSGERRSAAEWRPVKVSAPGPRHGLQCQRKANIVTPLSRPRPAPNDRASTALLEEVSPLCKSER